uniref:Homeobox domain-containing protein n=1 Tax=Ascaris lumbricoides TaxID=6252 RepID=A0A0M3IRC8_ASCLU
MVQRSPISERNSNVVRGRLCIPKLRPQKQVWFQNRRAKWRRQDKAESSAIADLPPVRQAGPTGLHSWSWMAHPDEFTGLMHPFAPQPNNFPPPDMVSLDCVIVWPSC